MIRWGRGVLLCLATVIAGAAWTGVAVAAKDDVVFVSRASGVNGAAGDRQSEGGSVTADGRFVVFSSESATLTDDDLDGREPPDRGDVFLRDTALNLTHLISRANGPGGESANSTSTDPVISADGRVVVFASLASNIGDANGPEEDVFARDLATHTVTLVSRATGAQGAASDGLSRDAAVSADGRYVAFTSRARNISAGADNGDAHVYVRDLVANTTTLVSRAPGAFGAPGDSPSGDAAISPDGRFVAFASDANNFGGDSNPGVTNVFVRDLDNATTTLVSRATGAAGTPGNLNSSEPSISAGGRQVAFTSLTTVFATDRTGPDVFVRDLVASTTTLVSRRTGADTDGVANSGAPSISADGRYVAFDSRAGDISDEDYELITPFQLAQFNDVLIRDAATNTTLLISRSSGPQGGGGEGDSYMPFVSLTGRFVGFTSAAINLSAEDIDPQHADVFVRDVLGETPAAPGPPGDGEAPVIGSLSMSSRAFAVAPAPTAVAAQRRRTPPRGTRFRYTLSEPANVSILIERRRPGVRMRLRRAGRLACRVATRRNRAGAWSQLRRTGLSGRRLRRALARRACVIHARSGQLSRAGRGPGAVSTPFTGRIGRRALRLGRYRATVTATDAAGNRSRPRRVTFRIVARR